MAELWFTYLQYALQGAINRLNLHWISVSFIGIMGELTARTPVETKFFNKISFQNKFTFLTESLKKKKHQSQVVSLPTDNNC